MFFHRPKPRPAVHAKSQRVGLDVTSTRLRAVVEGAVARPILLDSPEVDLRLALKLDAKPIAVGRAAYANVKRAPHLIAANVLGALGGDKLWKSGRSALAPDGALGLAFGHVAGAIAADCEALTLALPGYLSPSQVKSIVTAATVNTLPVVGTVSAALALVVDRADDVRGGVTVDDTERDGIVPIRPTAEGPGSAVVVDADDHALSASVVWVDRDVVRVLASAAWPKLASRLWVDRLIDALADRCVRLCRRDPRDSAEAEQSLFEQIEQSLGAMTTSRPLSFHLRAAHWVQDFAVPPAELDAACANFVAPAIANLTDLIYGSGVPAPPRAIWLTAAAAKLPGLLAAIYDNSAEATDVRALPADAVATAAARLAPRFLAGELPRQHLDAASPAIADAKRLPLAATRVS